MSTAGGPKLYGIGRGGDSDIVLCMDAHDAGSYPGEPTTNLIPYYDSRNPALVASKFAKEALWTSAVDSTDVIAPDGSSTTTKAVTGTSGNSYFYSYIDNNMGVTMASSTTYTISVWAKTTSTASTAVSLAFQDRGNGNYNTSVKTITTEWQRFSLTITTGSGATSYTLIGWVSPTNSRTFYFWGWQVEEKAYTTPYVVSQLLDPSAQGPSARPATTNLMIHGNVGTGQTFSDSSPSKHTITANGDTTHSGDQSKFSGGSIYFDGSDSLSIAGSTDFDFGTGDFTVDCWSNVTSSYSGYNTVWENGLYTDGILFRLSSSYLQVYINGTSYISYAGSWSADTWYHLALLRTGTTLRLFVDGVQRATATVTADIQPSNNAGTSPAGFPNSSFVIGRSNHDANQWFTGLIDEFRVTKGTALWRGTFTPPTRRNLSAPLVDLSGNYSGGNFATKAMTDVTTYRDGQVIEPVASAVWDLDGTDDIITLGPSSTFELTNAVSVYAWIKLANLSSWDGVFGTTSGGQFIHFQMLYGGLNIYVYGPAAGYDRNDTECFVTAGEWAYVGFTFGSNTLTVYRDGEPMPTTVAGSSASVTSTSNVSIGRVYSTGRTFEGQISNVQVYKTALTAQQVKQNFNSQRSRFKV